MSAAYNIAWYKKLLGDTDRGDFIGIEKNGHSAGYWKYKLGNRPQDDFYWGDTEMTKFVGWCGDLGKGLNLPLLGWQISIGHMGLANVNRDNSYNNDAFEDTFFPYFFAHVAEFIANGFIGFLVGEGLADDTDYSNLNEGTDVGDGGWFFEQVKEFDKLRPIVQKNGATAVRSSGFSVQSQLRARLIGTELHIQNVGTGSISLLTLSGKVVQRHLSTGDCTIHLSALAKGMYVVQTPKGSVRVVW